MRWQNYIVAVWLFLLPVFGITKSLAALQINSLAVESVESDSLIITSGLDISLPESIREALRNGIGIQIILEVLLKEGRKYLPDPAVGELRYIFEIKYHALSEQYVVTSLSPAERNAYPDLYSALYEKKKLSPLHLIMIEPGAIQPGSYLQAQLRIRTESLPLPLRIRSYFNEEWRATSGWTTWPI